MEPTREEILKVAYELKLDDMENKYRIAYVKYMFAKVISKDKDKDLLIESLLEKSVEYCTEYMNDKVNTMVSALQTLYDKDIENELSFILDFKFINKGSRFIITNAINKFLTQSGFEPIIGIEAQATHFIPFKFDTVEYNDKLYPVRTITGTFEEFDTVNDYTIAPESLLYAMHDVEGEDETFDNPKSEASIVDSGIYYYVDNDIFYESDEYIAKSALDVPVTITAR